MTDDTLPPRQPNTPRVLLRRLWAWYLALPEWPRVACDVAVGMAIGKFLL